MQTNIVNFNPFAKFQFNIRAEDKLINIFAQYDQILVLGA